MESKDAINLIAAAARFVDRDGETTTATTTTIATIATTTTTKPPTTLQKKNLYLRDQLTKYNEYGFFDVILEKELFEDDIPEYFKKKSPNNTDKLEAFTQLREVYSKLNTSIFPRFYDNKCRRPFVELSKEDVGPACRTLIFNEDGQLLPTFCDAVDKDSPDFSFIDLGDSDDYRFMIPILENSKERKKMIEVLDKNNIVNKKDEVIHGVVLIIGGTKVQNLHFDFPRNFNSLFLGKGSTGNARYSNYEVGWELNREAYNNAMMKSNAHSSLLIDVSNGQNGFKIGIPTNFLEFSDDKKKASIKNHDNNFKVHEIQPSLVTLITVNGGCQFVGDFAHCGADNVKGVAGEKAFRAMIRSIRAGSSADDILHKISEFKGLSNFCRLFLKTEPKVDDPLRINPKNVGIIDIKNVELNFAEAHDAPINQLESPDASSHFKATTPVTTPQPESVSLLGDLEGNESLVNSHLFDDTPVTAPQPESDLMGDVDGNLLDVSFQSFDNDTPEKATTPVTAPQPVRVPTVAPAPAMTGPKIAPTPRSQEDEVAVSKKQKYITPLKKGPQKAKSLVDSNRKASLRNAGNTPTINVEKKPSPKNITKKKEDPQKSSIVQTIKEPTKASSIVKGNVNAANKANINQTETPVVRKRKEAPKNSSPAQKKQNILRTVIQKSTKEQGKSKQKMQISSSKDKQNKQSLQPKKTKSVTSSSSDKKKGDELDSDELNSDPAITTVSSSIISTQLVHNGFFSKCVNLNRYLGVFQSPDYKERAKESYNELKKKIRNDVVEFDKALYIKYTNKDYGKKNITIQNSVAVGNQKQPVFLIHLACNRGEKKFKTEEWFWVRKSTLKSYGPHCGVRVGLFAAREFKAFECLGLFMGMIKDGVHRYTKYSATSKFGNCEARTSFVTGKGAYNYGMAIHEINDPYDNGPDDPNEAEAKLNTIMTDDLLLYSTRIIKRDEELFLKFKPETQVPV